MVDRGERRWAVSFSAIVAILLTLPYLLAYFFQGTQTVFTGFLIGVEDGNSYIAKMLSGAAGNWLFRTAYSEIPQGGALVFLPYLLLGKLTAPPGQHEQLVALFQLFRIAGTFFLGVTTYDFLSLFLQSRAYRRLGTALVLVGGGLGWLSLVGLGGLWSGRVPLEFYSPETFGFLMAFSLPHLAFARGFMLWGLRNYLDRSRSLSGWKPALENGLIWAGVGLMQPISIAISWAVIGGHLLTMGIRWLWQRRNGQKQADQELLISIGRAVLVGCLSVPFLVYTLLSFRLDPFLRNWEAQNVLTSPPFTDYLLAYAVVLPVAVFGMRASVRKSDWQGWFVVCWAALFPLLVYLPVTIQRRLVEGAWVALIILAFAWIEVRGSLVKKIVPRVLSLAFVTPVFFLVGVCLVATNPTEPLFLPVNEVRVFNYLAENAHSGEVVLASDDVSNPLPAWAPVRTIGGHGPESVNAPKLRVEKVAFYQSSTADNSRIDFLSAHHISYVIWSPAERRYGSWNPAQAYYLESVFEEGEFQLFQVHLEEVARP